MPVPHPRPAVRAIRAAVACAIVAGLPASPPGAQSVTAGVRPGIEVLLADSMHLIRGKRVGLITNHSGRARDGRSSIDLLHKAPGVRLTALFGPEHGIRGMAAAGEKVASSVDSATGVPVYSLYGETRVPRAEDLAKIDVLLYDIQDVGARVYTFQWTMALSAAAAGAKVPFIVLDRPNPIRADVVQGNILKTQFASFVGQFPVALRYGLTSGELMRFLVGEKLVVSDLKVVPMSGYRRSMWFNETGIPWINPSPNIRDLDAALMYPGTVFFEGTNMSEGRGTEAPFLLIGAQWMTDVREIVQHLNAMRMPGVAFEATESMIEAGQKQAGPRPVPMIRIRVTNRNTIQPITVGARMLRLVYSRHSTDLTWRESHFNRLAGTDELLAAVKNGTVDELLARWEADAAAFAEKVKAYRLYP